MKTAFYCALLLVTIFMACHKPQAINIPEAPKPNADSIRCVQAWQQFQIPNDTILQLRYQQPVKIANGKDTMAIIVARISDVGTQEEERTNDFSEARIWIQMSLNGKCIYQTKYGLMIRPRSDHPNFQKFGDSGCNTGNSTRLIDDPPAFWALEFYNVFVLLNQLTPFAKNTQELYDLAANPQKYSVTLWLKKRCF